VPWRGLPQIHEDLGKVDGSYVANHFGDSRNEKGINNRAEDNS